MNNNTGCEAAGQREPSYVRVNYAIEDMESVVAHARGLLAQITGDSAITPLKNKKNPKETADTLAAVLSSAPERIQKQNAVLHDLLNEISAHLF